MYAKKEIKDLRYLIRNGDKDLQVLVRRGNIGKYQQYPISELGAIAPLSPKQKNEVTLGPSSLEEENQGFTLVPPSKQTLFRQAALGRDTLVRNLASFIDGFNKPQN